LGQNIATGIYLNFLGNIFPKIIAGNKPIFFHQKLKTMLRYALIFFVIAVIAAVFGFGGIAAGAAGIAKILFWVFLVLLVISLIGGAMRRA
jgi:uncharacterized membrane protein YtjA (UPF0391 family)